MTAERSAKLLPLLRLQPALVQNNRLIKGKLFGDFETPEQKIPPNGLPGKDWETCMTMNGTWGYRSYDDKWKSAETLVRNLVDIASKGGNYLLNVGPTSEGEIPGPSIERLRAIGAWMQVNGEAIYGTSASPFAQALPWGRVTKKTVGGATTLYLHVFDWPKDGKLVLPGEAGKIAAATLLADGRALAVAASGGDATIAVPAAAPDPISSTVVVRLASGG
jgi:alpha-L-fucosidase